MKDSNNSSLPAEIAAVTGALDSLARVERAAPAADFEARIAAATMPAMKSAPSLRLVGTEAVDSAPQLQHATVHASNRSLFDRWNMRIAAMIAICGGLVVVWTVVQLSRQHNALNPSEKVAVKTPDLAPGATTQSNTDAADEALFAVAGFADEASSPLDDIRTRTDSLRTTIDGGLGVSELLSSEEGAT